MNWWQDMLERWGWTPPEPDVAAKAQQAHDLHQAAIDVRVSIEEGTARTRPLIARVERMTAALDRRMQDEYALAEPAPRRRKGHNG